MSAESFELTGARVLVMGLGAHGGGIATARYCAEHGAEVTVTDLQRPDLLRPSVEQLAEHPIRFVLGEHREEDFRRADIVVKNPAVPRHSSYLGHAARIETDISIFLAVHRGPVLAVTGTKGKSTAASALHHILREDDPAVRLGGNITVSPLSFADQLTGDEMVVLELSSFQLGDLLLTPRGRSGELPPFAVSMVTNLLADHQDYYTSMEAYAADKKIVFQNQRATDWVILSADDAWSRSFVPPHAQRSVRVTAGEPAPGVEAWTSGESSWLRRGDDLIELVPETLRVQGRHQRTNVLFAAVAACLSGVDAAKIRERAAEFPGIPHRLEHVGTVNGVRYYNDSAATIPDAAAAAVEGFSEPVHLIAGGSDKGLALDAFAGISSRVATVHLLEGAATRQLLPLLHSAGRAFTGPHPSLADALAAAASAARSGDVVLLSPGCASFGMFRNEFDRGDQFRELVRSLGL